MYMKVLGVDTVLLVGPCIINLREIGCWFKNLPVNLKLLKVSSWFWDLALLDVKLMGSGPTLAACSPHASVVYSEAVIKSSSVSTSLSVFIFKLLKSIALLSILFPGFLHNEILKLMCLLILNVSLKLQKFWTRCTGGALLKFAQNSYERAQFWTPQPAITQRPPYKASAWLKNACVILWVATDSQKLQRFKFACIEIRSSAKSLACRPRNLLDRP